MFTVEDPGSGERKQNKKYIKLTAKSIENVTYLKTKAHWNRKHDGEYTATIEDTPESRRFISLLNKIVTHEEILIGFGATYPHE